MAKIKRLGVIKTASFLGLFGVFIGLIFGLIMFIVTIILSNVINSMGDVSSLGTTSIFSIFGASSWYLFLLIFPLISGIINFLIGLIFTPLMNLSLKIINGLDLDIEMQEPVTEMQA